jgi:hypothetical protein
MLQKTQSHCSPNLIFSDVLNNSYMHTIYFFKTIKTLHLRNIWLNVKFEDLDNITVLNIFMQQVIGKGILLALK